MKYNGWDDYDKWDCKISKPFTLFSWFPVGWSWGSGTGTGLFWWLSGGSQGGGSGSQSGGNTPLMVTSSIKESYKYDGNGNVLSSYERGTGDGEANTSYTYKYDALNRVTSSQELYGKTSSSYTYDSLGNLTYEQGADGKIDYKLNLLNQITSKTADGKVTNYTYDKRGNNTKQTGSDGTATYTYDATNKMVKGVNTAGEVSEYVYNGLGVLTQNKLSNLTATKDAYGSGAVTRDFVTDYTSAVQNQLMEYESGSSQALTYKYVYGLEKLSVSIAPASADTAKMYYDADRLGSTTSLTAGTTGEVMSWAQYNEWGKVTDSQGVMVGSRELNMVQQYTNHSYDAVLSVYYAKARLYSADDKRFAAVDPVKGAVVAPMSLIQYIYCFDDPLSFTDPLGLMLVKIHGDLNNEFIDQITDVQKWLEKLGYLEIPAGTSYGTYGAATDQAIRDFQFDYGFAVNGNLTDNIYLSIYNAILAPEKNFTESTKSYLYNLMKVSLKNKNTWVYGTNYSTYYPPYTCYYSKSKPYLSELMKQNGVLLDFNGVMDSFHKDGTYIYNYTVPINNMLMRNLLVCKNHAINLDTSSVYEIAIAMEWFISMVDNGAAWDIKLAGRWNEQLPGVPYLGLSGNFIYESDLMNAEQLGNFTFGYWGTGMGFDEWQLLTGGDFASIMANQGFDSPEDKSWVKKGIQKYNM